MGDQIIRLRNALALCKLEAVEGVDAVPTANLDAFPFEISDVEVGSPYSSEESNEATGTMIAGAPLIIGQPVPVKFKFRLKGNRPGVVYSAGVRPPLHALLQSCGWRGQFSAGIAATALAAGTTTGATLGAAYPATAQAIRGQRIMLATGNGAGAHPIVTDYTAAKVATFTDEFTPALNVANTAEIFPNWTYAATSPGSLAERVADQPSSTAYFYEDGILYKLLGLRGKIVFSVDTAKPGYGEMTGEAIWGGQSDATMPADAVIANHAAPTLNMNSAVSAAFAIDRNLLPISKFTYDTANQVDSYEDPNTPIGFGAAQLGGRSGLLSCDPTKTLLAVRNALANLEAGAFVTGVVRAGTVRGNRWSLCFPRLVPLKVGMGTRKNARSETIEFRALSTGRDSVGRDGDAILCFD